MIPQLLDDIKALGPCFKTIKASILFGSVARGQERVESDIDLCFVLKNTKTQQEIQNHLLNLEKNTIKTSI